MAKVKSSKSSPAYVRKLTSALKQDLAAGGIDATVEVERISGTRLHRVAVLSRKFKHVRPHERQDIVWRIASRTLTPDEQLRISTILTVTPEEAKGDEE